MCAWRGVAIDGGTIPVADDGAGEERQSEL